MGSRLGLFSLTSGWLASSIALVDTCGIELGSQRDPVIRGDDQDGDHADDTLTVGATGQIVRQVVDHGREQTSLAGRQGPALGHHGRDVWLRTRGGPRTWCARSEWRPCGDWLLRPLIYVSNTSPNLNQYSATGSSQCSGWWPQD